MVSLEATEKMPISITGKALKKARNKSCRFCLPGGFSLVELMIVLAIMALVFGMAAPRIAKEMGVLHLRTTAKQVAASLRWARSQALSTGKTYNAIFDAGGQRVIISDYAGALDAAGTKPVGSAGEVAGKEAAENSDAAMPKQVLKIFDLPDDIFISRIEIAEVRDANPGEQSIYQLTFFPDGTSMGGEITIADEQKRSFIIGVDFLTGIVSLEEPDTI
jgi:general secretion pathway protein H